MQKALATMYKKKSYTVLELTITDNLLTLVIPGIKLELPCKTVHTAKATFDFHYFYDMVKTWDGIFFECIVTDNQLQMGVTKVTAQTTFFEDFYKISFNVSFPKSVGLHFFLILIFTLLFQ